MIESLKQLVKSFVNHDDIRVISHYDTDGITSASIISRALSRINKDEPESGKVSGYDMHDQSFMARTFGVDWAVRHDVPDILSQTVRMIDEPIE